MCFWKKTQNPKSVNEAWNHEFLLGLFHPKYSDHGKYHYISHPLTTKFHSEQSLTKENKNRRKTRCNCRHVFNNHFLWPRNDPPSNRTHPWCQNIGFPGPSSCPSQRRSFPRAAVPVAVAPVTCTAFNGRKRRSRQRKRNGNMKLTWQNLKDQ